jgi:hypothetical protein
MPGGYPGGRVQTQLHAPMHLPRPPPQAKAKVAPKKQYAKIAPDNNPFVGHKPQSKVAPKKQYAKIAPDNNPFVGHKPNSKVMPAPAAAPTSEAHPLAALNALTHKMGGAKAKAQASSFKQGLQRMKNHPAKTAAKYLLGGASGLVHAFHENGPTDMSRVNAMIASGKNKAEKYKNKAAVGIANASNKAAASAAKIKKSYGKVRDKAEKYRNKAAVGVAKAKRSGSNAVAKALTHTLLPASQGYKEHKKESRRTKPKAALSRIIGGSKRKDEFYAI